jgi:precorrin-4/cobalt-precorrin-4 C11-methyltransferase
VDRDKEGINPVTVHFIGAGPGAADLITVRGQRIIGRSPVCLYAGSLVPAELLAMCPEGAEIVDTARLSLDEITERLIAADRAGLDVARLHSGDPSIYSAVAEQARRLDAAGVGYEMVPGVPAFTAAAAALGRELTVPGVSQSIVLTRVSTLSTAMPPGEDLATLGASGATLVIHLAAHRIDQVVEELRAPYGGDCPVAVVAFASRPDEIILRGTVDSIAGQVHAAGVTKTAVIIVGRVLSAEGFPDSYLYSASRRRTDH